MPGDPALNVVDFAEESGRTVLTLLMRLRSREARDAVLSSGMEVGMQEQMDALDQLTASL